MRVPQPFVVGHVLGALVIGAVGGSLLETRAAFTFAIGMALGAGASAMVCKWWPGFGAPGWQLWFTGVAANPLVLVALGFAIDEYDCLLGKRSGWACMFSDIGPIVAGICLLPPLLGIGLRWLWTGPPGSRPRNPPPRPPPPRPPPRPRPPGSGGPGSSPRPR